MTLRDLTPGARFRLPSTGRTGTLLMVNECRARVRYDAGDQTRTVHEGTPDERRVTVPSAPVDITPNAEVVAL